VIFILLLGGIVSIRELPKIMGSSTQWSFVSLLSTLVNHFYTKKCMCEELSEIGTKHLHVNQLCKIFQPRYSSSIQMDCLILSKDLLIFKLGWCKVIKDVNQKCLSD
uniref:Uncharacterized protein n=1 Tax=Nomascus leucogenys TaxID=61853 RepID=A0A2I3H681_NOMLE